MTWYNRYFHYTFYQNMIPMTIEYLMTWVSIAVISWWLIDYSEMKTANRLLKNHFKRCLRIYHAEI